MGDGVVGGGCWGWCYGGGCYGGGCYGGWCCGRRVLGDGVMEEGVMGDGVMGGGGWCCGGMVLWGDGVVGRGDGAMDNTSEPTNIFRSYFWDYFLLCPLSPISSFSYLNSMYMYMCTSPSSPLAPSDVLSPLVVMATS